MPTYIIQDIYSGYIWGDTRNFDGEVYNAESIEDACRALDHSIGDYDRTYEEVSSFPGDSGYIVYRVDINGSEVMPCVIDGQDPETIEAVERDCELVGYVAFRYVAFGGTEAD